MNAAATPRLRAMGAAQAHESADHEDTHLHRALTAQNVRRHQRTVLGTRPWAISRPAMAAGTGRKLRPVHIIIN